MAAPTGAQAARLRDPALRRLRAIKMLEAKVIGARTNHQIAEMFNVHENTVERTLDWAKRAGLVASYEDQILQGLVPRAIEAFAAALEEGDTQVALEVLKGTGLLKKQTDKPLVPAQAMNDNDLAGYIRKIRGGTDAKQLTARPLAELVAAPRDASSAAPALLEGTVLADAADATASPASRAGEPLDEDRATDPAGHVDLPDDLD